MAKKKTGLALGDKDGIETKGICYDKKKEEVPLFNARKGDYVITGEIDKLLHKVAEAKENMAILRQYYGTN